MPARVRLSTCPWAAPAGLSCRCWAVFAALAALYSVLVAGAQSRACPGLIVSWWAAPFTAAGAFWAVSQGALPPLGAPPRPPLHGPARWAPARGVPGTLWGAGFLLEALWDSGHTSGPGSGAYRQPTAPGSRLLLSLGTERGEQERRSERGSCSNPIPGAAAAAASATAGEVT